jgi:hypothetical protein
MLVANPLALAVDRVGAVIQTFFRPELLLENAFSAALTILRYLACRIWGARSVEAGSVVDTPDQRRNPRTNLLLTASAEAGGKPIPVRIRNVSECGALIEGVGLPMEGAQIQLKRSDIEVTATIAWASGNRRGVRFDRLIATESWTGGLRVTDCSALSDQQRVDAIQIEARSGLAPRGEASAPAAPAVIPDLEARLAEELGYVQRLVEAMGDELVADPAVVHRHTRSLQTIDVAGQILSHLAAILRSDDQAAAVSQIGMDELRARLTRASTGVLTAPFSGT